VLLAVACWLLATLAPPTEAVRMVQRRSDRVPEGGSPASDGDAEPAEQASQREAHVETSLASHRDPEPPHHVPALGAAITAGTIVATAEVPPGTELKAQGPSGGGTPAAAAAAGGAEEYTHPKWAPPPPRTELKAQGPSGGGTLAAAAAAGGAEEEHPLVRAMDASMAVLMQYLSRRGSPPEGRPPCARGQNCATSCTCLVHETCYPSRGAVALVQARQNTSGAALHREERLLGEVKLGSCGWSTAAASISSMTIFFLLACCTSCTRAILLAYAERSERASKRMPNIALTLENTDTADSEGTDGNLSPKSLLQVPGFGSS